MDDRTRLICFFLILCGYIGVSICIGVGSTWYESIFCAYLGMLWCTYKVNIDKMLQKHGAIVLCILCLIFAGLIVLQGKYLMAKIISTLTFSALITVASYFLSGNPLIVNNISTWLGKTSLGIYTVQGIFLRAYADCPRIFGSAFAFSIVAIVGTIVMAPAFQQIYLQIRKAVD